jgi:hypothetical protein
MRLTVVCVLWMGEFLDRHYSPDWVLRLRDQVAAHLPQPHRFVCLSNVDVPGVETLPLQHGWPGWWSQVEMFEAARDLGDRVLYLDLDVFVTGDLTPIVNYPAPFALMPPSHVFGGLKPREMPGVVRKYQGTCAVFSPPAGDEMFRAFGPEVMATYRSYQDWFGAVWPDLPTMPPAWFAKVKQCRHGVPADVKVVLAHRVNLIGRSMTEVAA